MLQTSETARTAVSPNVHRASQSMPFGPSTIREGRTVTLEPLARAARMIEGHLAGILAHWSQGLMTAFMEGLNSLFSAVKRKARGYRSVVYMTTMLYFVAGKLTLPCY